MKENTAAIHAQVPVDVATYLLNEKRSRDLRHRGAPQGERAADPEPEPRHAELPGRAPAPRRAAARRADAKLRDGDRTSGRAGGIAQQEPEVRPPRPEPLVKGITPDQPAPIIGAARRAGSPPAPPRRPRLAPRRPARPTRRRMGCWASCSAGCASPPSPRRPRECAGTEAEDKPAREGSRQERGRGGRDREETRRDGKRGEPRRRGEAAAKVAAKAVVDAPRRAAAGASSGAAQARAACGPARRAAGTTGRSTRRTARATRGASRRAWRSPGAAAPRAPARARGAPRREQHRSPAAGSPSGGGSGPRERRGPGRRRRRGRGRGGERGDRAERGEHSAHATPGTEPAPQSDMFDSAPAVQPAPRNEERYDEVPTKRRAGNARTTRSRGPSAAHARRPRAGRRADRIPGVAAPIQAPVAFHAVSEHDGRLERRIARTAVGAGRRGIVPADRAGARRDAARRAGRAAGGGRRAAAAHQAAPPPRRRRSPRSRCSWSRRSRDRIRAVRRRDDAMSGQGAPIDFYFEFSSPYGYIASQLVDGLEQRIGRADPSGARSCWAPSSR